MAKSGALGHFQKTHDKNYLFKSNGFSEKLLLALKMHIL